MPDHRRTRVGVSLLSERHPGTIAERVAVPRGSGLVQQAGRHLEFTDAACLPTAWLTAYRMLIVPAAGSHEGESVLVRGAGGGVATAAVVLATALGKRVYVTSRDAGQAGAGRFAAAGRSRWSPVPGCPSGSTW